MLVFLVVKIHSTASDTVTLGAIACVLVIGLVFVLASAANYE